MDWDHIIKEVAITAFKALLMIVSYYGTKKIILDQLKKDNERRVWRTAPIMFCEAIGVIGIVAVGLAIRESWTEVIILFILMVIPAVCGLLRAVELRKKQIKKENIQQNDHH